MAGVLALAPAKVNLHLEVLGRRPDGFHDISSLFQAVSLFDEIRLERSGSRGGLVITGFSARDDTIRAAVEAFRRETGIDAGLSVKVCKRIPVASGLGGASSDAAAALRGLQALFAVELPEARLHALASALGSDVPFFLGGAAAVVEGRGERVKAIKARGDFTLVAATPGVGVSTAQAYSWIDEMRGGAGGEKRLDAELMEAMYAGPVLAWKFFNDFTGAVGPRVPEVRRLCGVLSEIGAPDARLTGSGSTVIAVFSTAKSAKACARALEGAAPGVLVHVMEPLERIPGVR